jgi:hypothetical protein
MADRSSMSSINASSLGSHSCREIPIPPILPGIGDEAEPGESGCNGRARLGTRNALASAQIQRPKGQRALRTHRRTGAPILRKIGSHVDITSGRRGHQANIEATTGAMGISRQEWRFAWAGRRVHLRVADPPGNRHSSVIRLCGFTTEDPKALPALARTRGGAAGVCRIAVRQSLQAVIQHGL